MTTIAHLIERARGPLNDASKRRYTDTMLIGYAVEGLRFIRRQRPDLFIGKLSDPFVQYETDSAALPLDDGYMAVLADMIVFRAQLHDTEAKAIEKSQAYLSMALKGLQ